MIDGAAIPQARIRIALAHAPLRRSLVTHQGPQPMPKAPRSKRKNDVPDPTGALSKYFPVDSIPSEDIKRGPPPPDPAQEEEAERSFLTHNDEGGFRTFANLYTMVYLAKPMLVQGIHSPLPLILNNSSRSLECLEAVQDDPWKLLIAVMLLNKTSGKVALPVFWYIVNRWSTPADLVNGGCCLDPPFSSHLTKITGASLSYQSSLRLLRHFFIIWGYPTRGHAD